MKSFALRKPAPTSSSMTREQQPCPKYANTFQHASSKSQHSYMNSPAPREGLQILDRPMDSIFSIFTSKPQPRETSCQASKHLRGIVYRVFWRFVFARERWIELYSCFFITIYSVKIRVLRDNRSQSISMGFWPLQKPSRSFELVQRRVICCVVDAQWRCVSATSRNSGWVKVCA